MQWRTTLSALASSACLVAFSTNAMAVVRITVQTVPEQIVAGQPFELIYGLQVQNDAPVQASEPRFQGLRVLGGGPPPTTSNMMAMGGFGGTFTVQTSTQYVLMAPRAGRYTISGIRATDVQSGRVVAQHNDLVVTVLPPGSHPVQAPQQQQRPGFFPGFPPGFPQGMMDPIEPPTDPVPVVADPDAPPGGDIPSAQYNPQGFVRVSVDNPTPYVGEQITFRVWLYIPSQEAACDAQHEPQLTGFWNEPLMDRGQTRCARQWFAQDVSGRRMMAGIMRKIALFPTHSGHLEISGMDVVAQYIEGDGFFGSRSRRT
jgi:hypothetical protein